jgi:2,3-dihydro-2,3-dihydroxybenzoate dehydrogenase
MQLQGFRLLVTGGSSGIGDATARLALERGACVHVFDLGEPEYAHARLGFTKVDVSHRDEVDRGVASAVAAMGGLDGVANVAGVSVRAGSLGESDIERWRTTYEINMLGALHVAECALPFLRKSSRASIVNVSSGTALRPFPGLAAYAASKSALVTATKVWAMELGPHIRANVVCPGAVDTPLLRRRHEREGGGVQKLSPDLYALKRIGQPREIACAIAFLLSDEASFITGATLPVDGGRSFH